MLRHKIMVEKLPRKRFEKGLGRGLSALLAEHPDDRVSLDKPRQANTVPLGSIVPNQFQPRRKFDPEGTYVRCYVPELAAMPAKHIHEPWGTPATTLIEAGVVLDKTYPRPIVDLRVSRQRALSAYSAMQEAANS